MIKSSEELFIFGGRKITFTEKLNAGCLNIDKPERPLPMINDCLF
jgi:hypothetical protein